MHNRFVKKELEALLKIMPVVFLTGARQSGKTTLVEEIAKERKIPFLTFDDPMVLSQARKDPSGWLESLEKPIILDEVQRAPEIFLPMKRDVDLNRHPGRYILTGSANPLLLPKIGDSLAGRMGILTMYPFSQGEIRKREEIFISTVFEKEIKSKKLTTLSRKEWASILLKGGYPPLQPLKREEDRHRWIRAYLQTMLGKDVRDLANIEGTREFPRLLKLLATRSSMILNGADLSRTMGMVNMTVNRYLRLLETLYFVYQLPAWFHNRGKRIAKSPKIFLQDTAILANLLEINEKKLCDDPMLMGQFLETFVACEVLKQKSWSPIPFELHHFRDGGYEVDLVLERQDGTLIGIEVKSAKTLQSQDLRGLRHLKKLGGAHFHRGIILHMGESIQRLEEGIWAMPLESLFRKE